MSNLQDMGVDPNATTIDARWCKALTQIEAPNAVTALTTEVPVLASITLDKYMERDGPMEKLLTAGGVSINRIVRSGAWDCHNWNNCPLHVAHGVNAVAELPEELQTEGARFLKLFDGGFLPRPDHLVRVERR